MSMRRVASYTMSSNKCNEVDSRSLVVVGNGTTSSPATAASSPVVVVGGGGGKARGGKLARRARSFKEDFLEKLSQMRSPAASAGGGGATSMASQSSVRTASPSSIRAATRSDSSDRQQQKQQQQQQLQKQPSEDKSPLKDLHVHVRQVQLALNHLRDVVSKNKLEMLPGNGTVVLDTVTTIHTQLKSYLLHENSSILDSATNQVYQALAQLLKLCDDVLLYGDQSSALDTANVTHVIGLVEDAVKNLIEHAQEKISNKQKPASNRTSGYASELTPQRNSLPDIPLTPRERQLLEQSAASSALVRASHSSESILQDSSPPKPSKSDRSITRTEDNKTSPSATPPPLPPKRRARPQQQQHQQQSHHPPLVHQDEVTVSVPSGGSIGRGHDRCSLRSRSPEDTSSLLSASAGSLDSAFNQSRDEDEIRAIMGPGEESTTDGIDLSLMATFPGMQVNGSNSHCGCWEGLEASLPSSMMLGQHQTSQELIGQFTGLEGKMERLSTQTQESGFVSMHSQRSSSQSYTAASSTNLVTKRSSQQSLSYNSSNSQQQQQQQQHQHQQRLSSETNGSSFSHRTSTTSSSSVTSSRSLHSTMNLSNDPAFMEKLEIESLTSSDGNGIPPALPEKRSKRRKDRFPSQYDNVPENEHLSTCSMHTSNGSSPVDNNRPPPLPMKKRHMFQSVAYSVMAYMEMFGNCSHNDFGNEFIPGLGSRHSMAAYNSMQSEWQQHEMSLTTQSCSFMSHTMSSLQHDTSSHSSFSSISRDLMNDSSVPPALPPKRSRSVKAASSSTASISTPPPVSPRLKSTSRVESNASNVLAAAASAAATAAPPTVVTQSIRVDPVSPMTCAKKVEDHAVILRDKKPDGPSPNNTILLNNNLVRETSPKPASKAPSSISIDDNCSLELRDVDQDDSILDELEINQYLVLKKPEEDGPDIRGGHPDALLVHATKANKHDEKESDFLYQEAFLTTYRTFMSPLELIKKLHKRHQRFSCSPDVVKQRAAREAFSLLVRVVSDLTISDLDETLMQTLMEFVQQLVCSGDLTMAKALRVKILEKHACKQQQFTQPILSSLSVTTKQASLLDFKSEQIAEQMTLLDAELFMKIEIPEVLIWAQEQNEERSPNLTRFTEHFNKMSYWARSRILEHRMENEAKDREKYVVKFIKIMKHLRKINNFNSYLALLSALDSAPIRRLEWQKHITEGLKEYCALIDSSSSFRAYRQALAETHPPCIPYIGLVLQDLTFVHIGNNDLLADGSINFSKRWQQFNIVENMKRFKKGTYNFKKNERIITFFNNFSDFLCEEAMWQISESIKPRGGKKTQIQS
ncbi:guanine nucleotide-releasing factor 2 isoform X2 [Trichogramma pretiosum]|uniref:guanine nucleotide-releasing factor 2 isoform X2 n=1 Tax=Trichogramma pretiosum TaxID=7493 RepID=UPI000C7194AF|nr:guanine nucleotide-releasing factor 2 isoform X2 [Trichogramma pretiosum]